MAKNIWRALSFAERDDIYRRVREAGEDPIAVAQELNMYPATLERRLREWGEFREAAKAKEERDQELEDLQPDEGEPGKLNIKHVDENNVSVTLGGERRIITLEELVKTIGLDMSVWKVDKWEVTAWEAYRKSDEKHVRWLDGRIEEGKVDDPGSIITKTLWRVRAEFVRILPVPVNPVVQPIHVSVGTYASSHPRFGTDLKKALIVPDLHVGFKRDLLTGHLENMHDRLAMNILLKVADMMEFERIIYLGDLMDLAEWSDKFARTPDFEMTTAPAVRELGWWLGMLRKLQPQAKMEAIEGNHDNRIMDMISLHVPAAYNVKPIGLDYAAWELPNLLDFKGLGIEWQGDYPNGEVWLNDDIKVVHGDRLPNKVLQEYDVSVVYGHFHRYEHHIDVRHFRDGDRIIQAVCPGFLGRTDGIIPARSKYRNWTQGLAIVFYDQERHEILPIPIFDHQALLFGSYLKGEDPSEQIRQDTGLLI